MNRRIDDKTAERVHLALLTQAAFDPRTALEFARLSGLDLQLASAVLRRERDRLRQQPSFFAPSPDRRKTAR